MLEISRTSSKKCPGVKYLLFIRCSVLITTNLLCMKRLITFTVLCCCLQSIAQNPTEICGALARGGQGFGTVFKTDTNGNHLSIAYTFKGVFSGYSGLNGNFCEANGKLYGVANGGTYDNGVILELDPATGKIIQKADFNSTVNGSLPQGLTLAGNGKLYGITVFNYPDNNGTLFEYDIKTNTIQTKIVFTGQANGSHPIDHLIAGSNGKLYGVTSEGGNANMGTLYEYDPVNNILTKKVSFVDSVNGAFPVGPLTEAKNGKLYGVTTGGGSSKVGTLFEYDIAADKLTVKVHFGGNTEGKAPRTPMILANDGALYGTINKEINSQPAILFKFDPATGSFTKVFDFADLDFTYDCYGFLTVCNNGLIYGTMSSAGPLKKGIIFEFNPATAVCTTLYNFSNTSGTYPGGPLMQASNGKLYGSTFSGGQFNSGVVFEFTTDSHVYKKLDDMNNGLEGNKPVGTMTLADNGKIYLVTESGGEFNQGTLIEWDPAINEGIFTKKIDFGQNVNGTNPGNAPVQASNGKLYGTTKKGGSNDCGILYEYDPVTGSVNKKYDFSLLEGCNPNGLIRAADNKLYGLTSSGGSTGQGVVFEFDPSTGICTKNVEFKGLLNSYPEGNLVQADNGKMYATGLAFPEPKQPGNETLFEYDPVTNNVTKKVDFDSAHTHGYRSAGNLVKAPNGKLYGMKADGPGSGGGTIYEYDPGSSTCTKKYYFKNKADGYLPLGTLLLASNNKFYGIAQGGSYNKGVLFEYDYLTNTYVKKFDFDGLNGMGPGTNTLIEICKSIPYTGTSVHSVACETQSFVLQSGFSKIGYTFQWYKDGAPVSSATAEELFIPTIQTKDAGVYTCKVNNGCRTITTADIQLEVLPSSHPDCNGNGIDENQGSVIFEIYPNPAADQVQIRLNNTSITRIKVELFDLLGKSVQQKESAVTGNETIVSMNISDLPDGVYIVRIADKENKIVENKKLVKQ